MLRDKFDWLRQTGYTLQPNGYHANGSFLSESEVFDCTLDELKRKHEWNRTKTAFKNFFGV